VSNQHCGPPSKEPGASDDGGVVSIEPITVHLYKGVTRQRLDVIECVRTLGVASHQHLIPGLKVSINLAPDAAQLPFSLCDLS
jgi:hypothetical protein